MPELPQMEDIMEPVSMFNRAMHSLGSLVITASFFAAINIGIGTAHAHPAEFAPFEVVYQVGNNHINAGNAVLQLSNEGNDWTYSLNTKPTGVFKLTGKGNIQETSVFTVSDDIDKLEISPQRYTYRQDKEARRSVDAWFDWSKNLLTYNHRGEDTTESIDGQLLDRLTVTLTVMDELQRDGFDKKQFNVFDNGRVKPFLFTNEGMETVSTPMGKLQAIRVRSNAAGGSTRHTTTWFAPQLGYVPVKIEQYKRKKLVARLKLSKLNNHITEGGGAKAYSAK